MSLLVPVLVFLFVNVPPWFGFSYIYVIFLWATFRNTLALGGNLEFPVTYSSAIATFAASTYLFRNRTRLPVFRSLIQAGGLAFAATALFEIIYQLLGYQFYPLIINGAVWPANYFLNGSWLLLAFTSVEYWRPTIRFKIAASVFVLSWIIWVALGFPQPFQPNPGLGLVAASITKILSFSLFLSLMDFRTKDIESALTE